jgi:hypothetical protein
MRRANNRFPAETIGLKALAFLAGAPEDMDRFMYLSGLDVADLRARASEPEFLAAVLDFLLGHEALLTAFCNVESLEARVVHIASHELAGLEAE